MERYVETSFGRGRTAHCNTARHVTRSDQRMYANGVKRSGTDRH